MADNVCGTGTGNFPQPGDPDLNNSILNAVPAFGGVDVFWTYPELNPHAVAHTILYRSTSSDPDTRVRHRTVTGDFYYDPITTETPVRYYYWIEVVSVNGTVGELIGPATAVARPRILDVIQDLTGQIDEGFLAEKLRQDIGQIDWNRERLFTEMKIRAENDASLGVAFNQVLAQTDETAALLQQETLARTTNDSAIINGVNRLFSEVGDNLASVEQDFGAFVDTINGDLADIGAYFTTKVDVNGLIGGFGIYNDGSIVEAGFDVDRFWIGRTRDDKTKPFIVDNGQVYIREAIIQSLVMNKLRSEDGSLAFNPAQYDAQGNVIKPGTLRSQYIDVATLVAQQAQSKNYLAGKQGWALKADGTFDLASGRIRDSVEIGGVSSKYLSDRALSVGNWTKPGTTRIDGNKIFTGDAYVDTLQVRGDAITATSYTESEGLGNWSDSLPVYELPDNAGVLFTINFLVPWVAGNSDRMTFVIRTFANGKLVAAKSQYLFAYQWQSVSMPVVKMPRTGKNRNTARCDVYLYNGNGTTNTANASYIAITALGAKR